MTKRHTARGFTVVELVATVTVIGLASAAAMVGVTTSMNQMRTASEKQRLVRDLRAERELTRDRLKALIISTANDGARVKYQSANFAVSGTNVTCEPDANLPAHIVDYPSLKLELSAGGTTTASVCLDGAGRPIGGTGVDVKVSTRGMMGREAHVLVGPAGTIKADFGDATLRNDASAASAVAAAKAARHKTEDGVVTETVGVLTTTVNGTVAVVTNTAGRLEILNPILQ